MSTATPEVAERQLIMQTISDIEEAVANLDLEIEMMQHEREHKLDRIKQWRARLAAFGGNAPDGKSRRRKGQNVRAIIALFKTNDPQTKGLSAAEISRNTGIALSSVRTILDKYRDTGFFEMNGIWFLKGASKLLDGLKGDSADALTGTNGTAGDDDTGNMNS